MKKKVLLSLFSLLVILVFANSAKATLIISQPSNVFNLGDTLDVNIKASYHQEINSFLRITLVCDSEENLMYFSPLKLQANKEKDITIEWPVSKALGFCHISASLEDEKNKLEEVKSEKFELTNKIEIEAGLNQNNFKPLEELKIEGKITKRNGKVFDGAVTILLNGKEYMQSSKDSFSFSIKLASDIAPNTHTLIINARDNYNNSDSINLSFNVAVIPTALEMEINNESFMPGETLIVKPKLLNQAKGIVKEEIIVKLSTRKGFFKKDTILLEELVTSGNSTIYKFTAGTEPGDYLLEAEIMEFKIEKDIEIKIFEKINFSIENSTLHVTNIGNVPYLKPLEVSFKIENQTTARIIRLNLGVGQTKVFELSAPKGNYEIGITGNNETANFSDTPLTGNIVSTLELNSNKTAAKIWILLALLIAIILLVGLLYFKKYKKLYQIKKLKKSQKYKKTSIEEIPKTDSKIKKIFKKHSAELAANMLIPSLVYGTKQEITTMVVSIPKIDANKDKNKDSDKNSNKISKDTATTEALENFFSKIMEKIKKKQGVADLHGNSLIVMFNIIKQFRHDVAAVRTAQEIRNISTKLNLKTKTGINTGMVTVSSIKADKSLKYTSIANTTKIAKALAEKAQVNEILLSAETKRRVKNVVKTRKISPYHINAKEAVEVYALEDATPKEIREKHKWFVDRALSKK